MGVHHLLSFGAGLECSRQDYLLRIAEEKHFSTYLLLGAIYIIFATILLCYYSKRRIIEQAFCFVTYTITFGIFNYSSMGSFYGTFMMPMEKLAGKIWHDSVIKLVTEKSNCTICKAGGCKPRSCYTLIKGLLYDELTVNCDCFKRYLSNRMELSRERHACRSSFEQSHRVSEGKYLFRSSVVEKYFREGCGVFDDDVIERHFDTATRSSCVRVRLVTTDEMDPKLATIDISRRSLDQVVQVPIDNPDRLFKMPQLRYSFLKTRAREEGESDIVFTPVLLMKRITSWLIAAVGICFASKTFQQEKVLVVLLVILTMCYVINFMFPERVSVEDLGGVDSRVSRMLAIDALSSGANLIKYSDKNTSWTRRTAYGGMHVGHVDMLESILHNRSIVMGDKIVSLSREGTSMFIADVQIEESSKIRSVHGWQKADRIEISEATKGKVPCMNSIIM